MLFPLMDPHRPGWGGPSGPQPMEPKGSTTASREAPVVDTITSNRDRWLETMMNEELRLQPAENSAIFRSAAVIFIATLIGHLIPLLPFVWLPRTPALILAIVLSALALFGVGVYSAVTLVGDWRKSGLKIVLIGLGAAAIGFLIGRLFNTAGA